jgi:lipopolysaccharide biosynthesis glycosyltransferase
VSRDASLVSVALCADKNIEVGLHVTLHSLLESSHHRIRINLVLKGYDSHDLGKIYNTLDPFRGLYELNIIEGDDALFTKCRGLLGNKFAFMKLMLPELLDSERIIYLDSDLIVRRDLGELFNLDIGGYAVAASGVAVIEWQPERSFFTDLGLNEKAKYFNTGVMLIDMNQWRASRITEKCLEFIEKHPKELIVADQTVLNYVLYENQFFELHSSYNVALYPTSKPEMDATGKIFHFLGSPKPWDFLGEFIHTNYSLFQGVLFNTAFRTYKSYRGMTFRRAKRAFRLGRHYIHRLGFPYV